MEQLNRIQQILDLYRNYPNNPSAFTYVTGHEDIHVSSEQFIDFIECTALALHALGIVKGDRIGIFAKSSPYWLIVELAVQSIGAISVPYLPFISEPNFLYQTTNAKPRFLFVGDHDDWLFVWKNVGLFESTISIEEGSRGKTVLDLFDLIREGATLRSKQPNLWNELCAKVKPDDTAAILYTSGTTGMPKGAELSHQNLVSIVHANPFRVNSEDSFLSFFPQAHIFAKQITLITLAWGLKLIFLNDLKFTEKTCRKYKPTCMIAVPWILEKIYDKFRNHIQTLRGWKKHLALAATAFANKPDSIMRNLLHPFFYFLVFRKFQQAFGGKLHTIASGGATLNPRLERALHYMGFPIYQGWGLTEGSAVVIKPD